MTVKTPTTMQQRYIDVFAGNHTEACRLAGYKNPERQGYVNSRLPHLQDAIRARENARKNSKDGIAKRNERQAFWSKMMRDEASAAGNRLKASELLGRSEGDFLDRVEQTGSQSVAITIISAIPEPEPNPEND